VVIQKNDPIVQIAHRFGQVRTGLLDQPQGIVFGDDELVDIVDGHQHLFDMA
jgi:hypothetical protein